MKMKTTPETIKAQCETLKLRFIRDHYSQTIQQAAQNQWPPEEIIARLLEGEIHQKADRALENRIKTAHFPFVKTLDDFDWSWPKKTNRAQIQHIFHLDWLPKHGNIFFLGAVGVGKTHLAIALGYHACRQGYSTRWVTAADMINTLSSAQKTGSLKAEIKTFLKPRLLIIDELGYMPIDKNGADLIFQIISGRYESGAICITSNKTFKQWVSIFNNDANITSAILDRLIHHGEPVLIEGKSYRLKDKIETN